MLGASSCCCSQVSHQTQNKPAQSGLPSHNLVFKILTLTKLFLCTELRRMAEQKFIFTNSYPLQQRKMSRQLHASAAFPLAKQLQQSLNSNKGGRRSRYGSFVEEKNCLSFRKSNQDFSVLQFIPRSLQGLLTTLSSIVLNIVPSKWLLLPCDPFPFLCKNA